MAIYTANVVDAGLFHILGKPPSESFDKLRAAVEGADATLRLPPVMYEELGGDPAADGGPAGSEYVDPGIREGWIGVTDPVPGEEQNGYADADDTAAEARHVARAYMARQSRHSTLNEWNDTALVGETVRLFEQNERIRVIVHTNDRKLADATLRIPPEYGYYDVRVELYDPNDAKRSFPVADQFRW